MKINSALALGKLLLLVAVLGVLPAFLGPHPLGGAAPKKGVLPGLGTAPEGKGNPKTFAFAENQRTPRTRRAAFSLSNALLRFWFRIGLVPLPVSPGTVSR